MFPQLSTTTTRNTAIIIAMTMEPGCLQKGSLSPISLKYVLQQDQPQMPSTTYKSPLERGCMSDSALF